MGNVEEKKMEERSNRIMMVPFEVLGIGIIISYGIALLMKITLGCIRIIGHKKDDGEEK